MMSNSEVAEILSEMADYYDMEDVAFKPRVYEKAAQAVASFDEPVSELYKRDGFKGLLAIPGVGRGIAGHIEELLKTGKLGEHQAFKKKIPVNLAELRSLAGMGPKSIKILYEKLAVRNLRGLQRAVGGHKIRNLAGFGERSEQKIAEALRFQQSDSGRFILGHVFPMVEDLSATLEKSRQFRKLVVGGSFRRRQETLGDIDILVVAENSKAAGGFFVNLPNVQKILAQGPTKCEVILRNGLQVDLRMVSVESWGAALQYFTGDKAHNVHLRKIAIAEGLKLSEYGLFEGRRMVAGRTEEEVYKKLGMAWIPPELRTDSGEIEAAQKNALPKILEYGSVRGDLQTQTDWSDGSNSIEEMARSAQAAGLEYIAVTDHSKSLRVANGLDERRLLKQMSEIDRLNGRLKNFRLLKGAEVNILKDGSLDIADKVLAKLDVVGVSIHSLFKISRKDMTARLVRAMANPNVDIYFHPTTRIIQKRPAIDFDFDAVLRAAKKYKVALEINAYPERTDLHDTLIRKAVDAGVKLTIDSDAHHISHFKYLPFGEAQARRGWATATDVLNTREVGDLLKSLRK